MVTVLADDLLRGGPLTTRPTSPRRLLVRLGVLLVLCGGAYGAVMGAYGGHRLLQPTYSAVKVPLLLGVTFALSLPSFFVLNRLAGVGRDFGAVLRALVATQAALTVVLAAVAPITALWYVSTADYTAALVANMAAFAVAAFAAQLLLRRRYAPLIAADPRHRPLLRSWLLVYAFVGIQMGWTLRPFVGNPGQPTTFFRQGAWGNAYVEVAGIVRNLWR